MRLKTYLGRTLREAMDQAKEDLGGSVSILESRQIEETGFLTGGRGLIQITAAVDDGNGATEESRGNGTSTVPGDGGNLPFGEHLSSLVSQSSNPRAAAIPVQSSELADAVQMATEFAHLRHEMNKLNRRLRKMTSPDLPELFLQVYEQLLESGMSGEHVISFVRRAYLRLDGENGVTKKRILECVKSEIISFFRQNDILEESNGRGQRIVFLIGPTGAGKTTVTMKLALHPAIFGSKNVAIISTDTYRVAASEPLKVFSRIASIPMVEIRSPGDVHGQIEEWKDRDVILIDTAGRSPYFPNHIQELREYLSMTEPTDILLVLGMTADLEDLYLTSGVYLTLNPSGLVMTKMDETGRPGKIISLREETRLPVAYISDGQSIPNDIRAADGEFIWERILKSG